MEEYPFNSVFKIIGFWVENNPAKAKGINLLEPEGGNSTKPSHVHIQDARGQISSFEDPHALWSFITTLIDKAMNLHGREAYNVFAYLRLGVDRTVTLSNEEFAEKSGIPLSRVRKYIREINKEIERAAIFAELLPPDVDKYN